MRWSRRHPAETNQQEGITMWVLLFVLFMVAWLGGGIFGRIVGLIIRLAFLLILAGLFIHP
jgi:hypothetical protein